jgi:hypothetical protein
MSASSWASKVAACSGNSPTSTACAAAEAAAAPLALEGTESSGGTSANCRSSPPQWPSRPLTASYIATLVIASARAASASIDLFTLIAASACRSQIGTGSSFAPSAASACRLVPTPRSSGVSGSAGLHIRRSVPASNDDTDEEGIPWLIDVPSAAV